MVFFRQLAVMVQAGLTISESLKVLSEQEAAPSLKRVARALYARVQGGSSLSDAMKRQDGVFPRLAVYLTGVGELLTNKLLTFNAKTMDFRKINVKKTDKCPICGTNPTVTELIDYEQAACDLKNH